MVTQTLTEWREEAARRFGKSPANWAFVCPACGKVSTVRDFLTLGKGPNEAAQNCIGRYNGHMRPASEAQDGQGCNWAAYGLCGCFGKGRIVTTEEGGEIEVFDFAPGGETE